MIRQRYILMIAIFISLMIMKSVNAHSDNDEEEDNFNHQKFVEYLDNKDFDDEDESDDYHRKHNHDEDGNCVMKFENSTTTDTTTDTTIDALDININPIRGINPTDGLTGARVCSGASIDPTFDRFTALFFGDFITFGGQDILGPLAVKGNFRAPNYVVNANRGQDCSSKDSLESYGLVVGGAVNTENTQIHGSIYAGKGGDLTGLVQLEHDCVKTGARGTGLVDFDDLEKKAIEYSFSLAAQHPTLVLGNDGAIKRVDQTRDGMEFITFNSCNPSSLCENIWPDAMSNPNEAISGQGNWNGVKGNQPDPGITYVFNIPVVETTTLSINTNQPTVGFNGCRIVLNFYPIKTIPSSNDDYSTFSIVRNTGSPLYGFVLAPYGNIRDGSTGTFTGSVVGRSYTWANMNGVEIHDYRSGGLNCQSYDGCIPKGASNMMGSSSSSEGCVKTETAIYNNFETTTIDHTSTVYHTDTVGHTDTDIVYFYNTVTVDHTDIVDHTDTETTDKTITVDHTTTVGTIVVAAFTTTADNTVTSTKTDTDTTTRESTTTTTEQNTVTSTQDNTITTTRSTTETTTVTDRIENTVTTTKDNTVTEDHTVFAANVVTTIEEVTTHVDIVTNNILTVSETETTTKILIGNVVVKPDTTYTEVNIQTVTLLMPTTATETSLSIQTETVINLIYDTVTVPSIKKELSTSTLTIETHLVSTDTVTLLGAITNTVTTTATLTGCTTDILSSIQNNDQSKSEMPAPPPSTYTHIHNENCGHEYKKNDEEKHKYKNYQKNKHHDEDNNKEYEEDDKYEHEYEDDE